MEKATGEGDKGFVGDAESDDDLGMAILQKAISSEALVDDDDQSLKGNDLGNVLAGPSATCSTRGGDEDGDGDDRLDPDEWQDEHEPTEKDKDSVPTRST